MFHNPAAARQFHSFAAFSAIYQTTNGIDMFQLYLPVIASVNG